MHPRMMLCLIALAVAAVALVNEADSREKSKEGSGEIKDGSGEVEENPLKPIVSLHNSYYMVQQGISMQDIGRLSSPFINGQTIDALGTVSREPTEIEFGFHKSGNKGADMPLHLSFRFDEGKIIYNTFTNGTWGDKEQKIDNPFKAGKDFSLRIRIIDNKYHVFANRKAIGKFDIQQGLDKIEHVSIAGDLDKLILFHYEGQVLPGNYEAIANLVPGQRLDISGVPTGNFNVNLYRENREYALQLSVSFHEKVIARNSMENRKWVEEETEGGFPFNKEEVFDLSLFNLESSVKIFVNGKLHSTFKHRGKPNDLKTLEVEGDVELHIVNIKNNIDTENPFF